MLDAYDDKAVKEFNSDSNDLDSKYLNPTEAYKAIQKGDIEGLKD